MGGGFSYTQLEEHGGWVGTLESAAAHLREFAMDSRANKVVKTEPQGVGTQVGTVPLDMGDRARLMRAAHRLDTIAKEIRKTHEKLVASAVLLRAVEAESEGYPLSRVIDVITKGEEERR